MLNLGFLIKRKSSKTLAGGVEVKSTYLYCSKSCPFLVFISSQNEEGDERVFTVTKMKEKVTDGVIISPHNTQHLASCYRKGTLNSLGVIEVSKESELTSKESYTIKTAGLYLGLGALKSLLRMVSFTLTRTTKVRLEFYQTT